MEPEDSLLSSQEPATSPYSESDESNVLQTSVYWTIRQKYSDYNLCWEQSTSKKHFYFPNSPSMQHGTE
jgi:hypothetical protein